jgi:uncharacterized protein involved in outer membrane biogenesis
MFKWVFKWLIRLIILAAVLGVILFLSRNAILRVYVEHEIHARTGMDAEIGRFSIGLAEPEITIQNLRLYNPPDFAGTPFLKIPELHVEYDPVALAQHQLRITLLRLDLGELDIVKNQSGQTNVLSMGLAAPLKKTGGGSASQTFTKQTGLEFKGIDVLNISIGRVRFIDLEDQHRNRTQNIGIENLVIKNVQSRADLAGLAVLVALRGGSFFDSLAALPGHGPH